MSARIMFHYQRGKEAHKCKEGDKLLFIYDVTTLPLPVCVYKYVLKNAVCYFKHNNLWSYIHCQYNTNKRCMCISNSSDGFPLCALCVHFS